MSDFPLPPLDGGERIYRALLHLYPARFRRAFAQDLVETFRDQHRDHSRHDAKSNRDRIGVIDKHGHHICNNTHPSRHRHGDHLAICGK